MYKHYTELDYTNKTNLNLTPRFYFQRRMKAILKYSSSHQHMALKCMAVAEMCRVPVESIMVEDAKQITFTEGVFEIL